MGFNGLVSDIEFVKQTQLGISAIQPVYYTSVLLLLNRYVEYGGKI